MAQLTITVANSDVDRIMNALGYQETINGQPNPETKTAYAQRQIIEWLKSNVRRYEGSIAARAARAAASGNTINIT
jgi:hypothetical protein